MSNREDGQRVASKRDAALARIREISDGGELLLRLLDETKLDMLLLALNAGRVEIDLSE